MMGNNPGSCPLCFAPMGLNITPTKKGGWYFWCRACLCRGFINSPLTWRAFKFADRLTKAMTEEEIARAIDSGPSPIDEMIKRHLVPMGKPQPEEVKHGRS